MCDRFEKREDKDRIEKVRCTEILASIICDFESEQIDEKDFEKNKEEILKDIKKISVTYLQRYHRVEDLECKLLETMGENFILYIPEKSKLILRMEKIYKEKYTC